MNPRLKLDESTLARFCERYHIRRLALFGSQLKGTARPDSDIDLLVEFEPDRVPSLLDIAEMELELSDLLGGQLSIYARRKTFRDISVTRWYALLRCSMRAEDSVRIRHMIDAAESAMRFVGGRSRADLEHDEMLRFALVRAVEIIGEAASKMVGRYLLDIAGVRRFVGAGANDRLFIGGK